MNLIMVYLKDVYPKESVALGVLQDSVRDSLTPATVNNVRFVGDWFDVYAALALERGLSEKLRQRVGLDGRLRCFRVCFHASVSKDQINPDGWSNIEEFVTRPSRGLRRVIERIAV